ncbi:MAG: hypothetical protein AAF196_16370 [Planctomycetota bacterium]
MTPSTDSSANIRRIGLSLGADLCWPKCFEDILADLDPTVSVEGPSGKKEKVRFEVERMSIEPFELLQPAKYDLVIDRLTHWYHTSREWIKKAVILDGVYVFNNPWSVQSMEKQTTYCAMMKLGMPIPKTLLLPPKEYEESADLQRTLESYAQLFDLKEVGERIGYPLFMKPYDGGGWVGVSKIDNAEELAASYDTSGKFVMHLQKGVVPYEAFVRGVGIGPQVRCIRYDPSAPLHQRYTEEADDLFVDSMTEDDLQVMRDTTLTINSFFGWDFNSCEALLNDGVWHPIDFANPCPDSQVTSLHLHFPWIVLAKMKWGLFCAATKRRFRQNLHWQPYWDVAQEDLPYREKLRRYAQIANRRFETDRFEEFCATELKNLDETAYEYFESDRAKDAVRIKVEAVFPENEWDEFTDYFWDKIQVWRLREGQKPA